MSVLLSYRPNRFPIRNTATSGCACSCRIRISAEGAGCAPEAAGLRRAEFPRARCAQLRFGLRPSLQRHRATAPRRRSDLLVVSPLEESARLQLSGWRRMRLRPAALRRHSLRPSVLMLSYMYTLTFSFSDVLLVVRP